MSDLFPAGYDTILKGLIEWGKSGLIPNTEVIKSYQPPIQDPMTGVPVLLPATVYKTGRFATYDAATNVAGTEDGVTVLGEYTANPYTNIDNLSNAPRTGSNVRDWNVNVDPGGPDTYNTRYYVPGSPYYEEAAKSAVNDEHYQQTVTAVTSMFPTVAERLTSNLDTTLPMITDDREDAKNWYAIPQLDESIDEVKDQDYVNQVKVAKGITDSVRPYVTSLNQTVSRYEMLPTKVPCAIPGVLNCRLVKYDSVDVRPYDPTYIDPRVDITELPDSLKTVLKHPTESPDPPSNPTQSDRWWNTDENKLYVYDGTYWVLIGTANTTVYQLKGEINY